MEQGREGRIGRVRKNAQ
ncbi:hypothetical protein E2C01_091067 [Portunus trituberculatus]|uniref:Uncharacterized protein n=1 Tax=Portunus trituberculatus TaxID=210409 RepID=A0A5B7JM10_PORTR|nr:hypothetical protein [Portunus trituberculatus]